MKPLIFHQDNWTHHGVCEHLENTDADRIVVIESTALSMNQKPGLWIGRKADAPWDMIQRDDPNFVWYAAEMQKVN